MNQGLGLGRRDQAEIEARRLAVQAAHREAAALGLPGPTDELYLKHLGDDVGASPQARTRPARSPYERRNRSSGGWHKGARRWGRAAKAKGGAE